MNERLTPADAPKYTQTPNVYYDEWQRRINSLAEMKVVNAIIRATFGWHKERDALTVEQMEESCGLSRPSVIDGIKRALAHGIVERIPAGRGYAYKLKLKPDGDDASSKDSLQKDESEGLRSLTATGKDSEPVKNLNPQNIYKDSSSEKERKETAPPPPLESSPGATGQESSRGAVGGGALSKFSEQERETYAYNQQPPLNDPEGWLQASADGHLDARIERWYRRRRGEGQARKCDHTCPLCHGSGYANPDGRGARRCPNSAPPVEARAHAPPAAASA